MPITVGIPFYNAEKYLPDAIRSVFAQTCQDWELILVDDGSTDRSLEIACSVNDPRVRVISDGHNRNLSYRLNQITSEAKYDLIGRMDADDLISPTRFEKQLAVLEAHPEVDLVTTGLCSLTKDNIPIGVRCGGSGGAVSLRKLLRGQSGVVHASILGRKSWFLRNPYDTSIARGEDYELWLRSYVNNDFKPYFLNEPLYYYREESGLIAEKMLRGYHNRFKQIRKYAFPAAEKVEAARLVARLFGKAMVVKMLNLVNKTDLLIRVHNQPITDKSRLRHFYDEIRKIRETELPL